MNISRNEQRVLHALAQGGAIMPLRDGRRRIVEVECYTREGWRMPQCSLAVFKKLKAKRAIASSGGGPYRITRLGNTIVRSQLDNR